jgi:hypothetical protein
MTDEVKLSQLPDLGFFEPLPVGGALPELYEDFASPQEKAEWVRVSERFEEGSTVMSTSRRS